MKLNLDALRKDLAISKKKQIIPQDDTAQNSTVTQTSSSGQQNTSSSSGAAQTSSLTGQTPVAIQPVVPKVSSPLRLISLEKPAEEVKKPQPAIKLISLDKEKKTENKVDMDNTDESVQLPSVESEKEIPLVQPMQQEVAQEEPVANPSFPQTTENTADVSGVLFQNLTKESHHEREKEKQEFNSFKQQKYKKTLIYAGSSLTAVFVLTLGFVFGQDILNNQSIRATVTPTTTTEQKNENSNAGAEQTNMNTEVIQEAYITGDMFIEKMENIFPTMENAVKEIFENSLRGRGEISILEAVKWGMNFSHITILVPRDPSYTKDAYIISFALDNVIVTQQSDVNKFVTEDVLQTLIQVLEKKKI